MDLIDTEFCENAPAIRLILQVSVHINLHVTDRRAVRSEITPFVRVYLIRIGITGLDIDWAYQSLICPILIELLLPEQIIIFSLQC